MKIKVFSDLHCDINNCYNPVEFFGDIEEPVDFYLDCGDCGELDATMQFYLRPYWMNKKVYAVAGNHTYYARTFNDTNSTLKKFGSNIKFLNNECVDLSEDVCLIGATLWTDFKLFGDREQAKEVCMWGINDYNYIVDDRNYTILPEDTYRQFQSSYLYIQAKVEANPNKKFIIMTHHAPSIQSVKDDYKTDIISAAFASNLEDFINANPNIKYWVHGHVHNQSNYKIGECQVIANPYGYNMCNESYGFDPNLVIQI